jgi:hypothetical protein
MKANVSIEGNVFQAKLNLELQFLCRLIHEMKVMVS